uniref:ATP synthase B chain n=1 Tax=Neogoniolithon spectabile TaxID=231755 RepID=A0A3G3MIK8_9FLOR|nr:ATP synthase B chain precursor [Neogoniolithon spectabile]AYR06654.1 ATP synthase B chain precursor [Neogoniolithon spectabile]
MKMTNILPYTLAFVFMTRHNIILLNEEFLIFLCFIAFVMLNVNKFGTPVYDNLKKESINLENNLKNFYNESLISLKKNNSYKKRTSKRCFLIYVHLGNYYYNFGSLFNVFAKNCMEDKLNSSLNKNLAFLHKVEKQTLKLFTLILIDKLQKLLILKGFYSKTLKVKNFKSINSLSIRESINKIN